MNINITELRANMAECFDRVCDTRDVLHVTRANARSVVVISEDEFEGIMETVHLLRSPANAAHLLASIAEADAGHLDEFDPT